MPTLPTRIGNFEVLGQIGSGGMGAVYLGRDSELNRQVAIKVIREEVHDQEVLDRFFREARAAAALRHPNIITIYASGQHEHQPYMVMEFVDGESLADVVKNRRDLPVAVKLSYLEQICSGLHFAHRAGIVHRDIKPANVMVDKDGMVRILDFGIARIEGSAMTQDGALIGSLNYMSPEQMLGRTIDLRSDIFSVGSVAYELLSYQQAFKGSLNDGLLQRLPYHDPPSLSDIVPGLPAGLEGIIVRALQKAPEDRFQDLSEMRAAIVEIQRRLDAADEQRTVVISRAALESMGADQPPPAAVPSAMYGGMPEPAPAPAVPVAAPPMEAPAPAPQTWSVRKKEGTAGEPRAARPSTAPTRPPTVAPRAPTTTARPARAPQASRRTWILVSVGLAALAIGAVALPWLTAAPPDPLEQARPGIQAAMERFRIGYRNRDMAAVTAAFPTLPRDLRQSMERTFRECLVYEVTFDQLTPALAPTDPAAAQADVQSTHTCTLQSGGRETTTRQHTLYTLRKNGENWVISGAARAAGSPDRPQ